MYPRRGATVRPHIPTEQVYYCNLTVWQLRSRGGFVAIVQRATRQDLHFISKGMPHPQLTIRNKLLYLNNTCILNWTFLILTFHAKSHKFLSCSIISLSHHFQILLKNVVRIFCFLKKSNNRSMSIGRRITIHLEYVDQCVSPEGKSVYGHWT